MLEPLAVDLHVLRTLLTPDIKIVPGRAMMARVLAADGSGRGALSIAGLRIDAALPPNVRPGQDLRLVVRDVSAERVLLSVSHDQQPPPAAHPAPAAVPPPPPEIPLPGGTMLQVTERDARGGAAGGEEAGAHTLALRYETPALGALDLRFAMDPGSLALTVTLPAGVTAAAQAGAEELRRALADEVGRAVSVTILPRRDPVDVYA